MASVPSTANEVGREESLLHEQHVKLEELPLEIHLNILHSLEWQSIKAFRLTCRTFASIVPKQQLTKHYSVCSDRLFNEEKALKQSHESEFWEMAEEIWRGLHPNYAGPSSHDSDLDALAQRWTCSSEVLPCYTCLRWLPSTTSVPKFATVSRFSRTRSVLQFDLGGKRAKERFCIDCGFRKGHYLRGTVVKRSVVCLHCGKLGDPIPSRFYFRVPGPNWWRGYFCEECYGDERVAKMNSDQYVHERNYGKYDAGLKRGKEYRAAKGKRIRRERGIDSGLMPVEQREVGGGGVEVVSAQKQTNTGRNRAGVPLSEGGRGPNAGYCPVMKEMRFCFCGGYNPAWMQRLRESHVRPF